MCWEWEKKDTGLLRLQGPRTWHAKFEEEMRVGVGMGGGGIDKRCWVEF